MNQRHILIELANSNPNYRSLCRKVSVSYADDILQEICLLILEMPEEKLPQISYFNFWFYRVAFQIIQPTGSLGKIIFKKSVDVLTGDIDNLIAKLKLANLLYVIDIEDESISEIQIKKAELVMLSLTEFENRIIHLYNQTGSMLKVQRITGVSYSALRKVKEKLRKSA